jgi:hypothetical protein
MAAADTMGLELRPGDEVEVFYRLSEDAHRTFPVADAFSALLRPRIGWTDGWVPARVLQAWPPPGADAQTCAGRVHVCHTHPLWTNRKGEMLDEEELAASAAAAFVAARGDAGARKLAVEAVSTQSLQPR